MGIDGRGGALGARDVQLPGRRAQVNVLGPDRRVGHMTVVVQVLAVAWRCKNKSE